ncbi:family 43 glycosylhydrolase [Streptomyces sp. NPDC101234]|uniref:family 43 glycosylhydrolase n=1 Tax=Streptomyces sp. NPDC101234 TaxID=3366138 RepID=UPI0038136199
MRPSQRVICNPLDLAYRYQDIRSTDGADGTRGGERRRSVHREAADPSIVRYRGRFYMFVSMSAGFWHSEDLLRWEYRPTSKLPALDYAPDVREVDGALYISASRRRDNCPFFRSVDPLADDFVEVTRGTFPFWDPNLFQDDDGAVYLYWGCDNDTPLKGARLSDTFERIGEPLPLVRADVAARGWEQVGEDDVTASTRPDQERLLSRLRGKPYIEGAWMTKRGGIYYLQYAAPATQLNTYADGYCTAASPLGPFEYSLDSPFSSKPGGFITGAGHGSTFQDRHGNWWHAATMRISVNDDFERRIGIFPAGFDDDGVLFCNQNFADYPFVVPDGPFDPWTPPAWALLSYKAVASASSSAPGHTPASAVDEDVRTWWAAGGRDPGESLTVDLGESKTVYAVQVNLADHELGDIAPQVPEGADWNAEIWRGIFPSHQPVETVVEVSRDGRQWTAVRDSRGTDADAPHAFIVLDAPVRARFVRVTGGRMPFEGVFAVSGVRVFGTGDGAAPGPVRARARRVDGRTARIEWDAASGATGYNVRYGRHPEKLYHSWQVHEQTSLDLRSFNADADYWVAVDAFGEGGITTGEPVPVK